MGYVKKYLIEQNIDIHNTSNNNRTTNSEIERLHNTINEHIRLLKHDQNRYTQKASKRKCTDIF